MPRAESGETLRRDEYTAPKRPKARQINQTRYPGENRSSDNLSCWTNAAEPSLTQGKMDALVFVSLS